MSKTVKGKRTPLLGRATLQEWVLRIHGTRSDPARIPRSFTTRPSPRMIPGAGKDPLPAFTLSPMTLTSSTSSSTWQSTQTDPLDKDKVAPKIPPQSRNNPNSGSPLKQQSALRSKTATLSDWGMIIHGTKESPDRNVTLSPTGLSAVSSTDAEEVFLDAEEQEPVIQQSNLNEDRASVMEDTAEPSPSSSSSSWLTQNGVSPVILTTAFSLLLSIGYGSRDLSHFR